MLILYRFFINMSSDFVSALILQVSPGMISSIQFQIMRYYCTQMRKVVYNYNERNLICIKKKPQISFSCDIMLLHSEMCRISFCLMHYSLLHIGHNYKHIFYCYCNIFLVVLSHDFCY